MKLSPKDFAVSPVIGTILLVAITVVLVAIISAVVMGMTGNVGNSKAVGLTVTPSNEIDSGTIGYSGVKVIIHGGKDVDKLTAVTTEIEGAYGTLYFSPYHPPASFPTESIDPIGAPLFFFPIPTVGYAPDGYYDDVLVVVKGEFTDGTSSVLYQGKMTLPPYKEGRTGDSFAGMPEDHYQNQIPWNLKQATFK